MKKSEKNEKTRFFEKPSHKWSMGKYLLSQKRIWKNESHEKTLVVAKTTENEALNYYKTKGVLIDKIEFATFFLKNGLPYEGIVASEKILPNRTLMRIPKELVLSTRNAYHSELRIIFEENQEFFWKRVAVDEDLVLILFILYEINKGKNSEFYFLLSSLPKEQDLFAFWQVEEIKLMEDDRVLAKCLKIKEKLTRKYNEMKKIVEKYESKFDFSNFTLLNFVWAYAILSSRSFGTFNFLYVSMIPLAEKFNHELTKTTFQKSKGAKLVFTKLENEEVIESETSSEGSYHAKDIDLDEDYFDYEYNLQNDCIINKENEENKQNIRKWLEENLDFYDIFSLVYSYKVLNFLEYAGTDNKFKEIFTELPAFNENFKKELIEFYNNFLYIKDYDKYLQSLREKALPKKTKSFSQQLFYRDFKEDIYKYVEFRSAYEIYEKGCQVYFPYGTKSNHELLSDYSMAIEYNKCGYTFIRIEYTKYLPNFDFRMFFELIKNKKLQKLKKIKLKYINFNVELLAFCKLLIFDFKKHKPNSIFYPNDLDLELESVSQSLIFLENSNKSEYSYQRNQEILLDKKTSYHEYFITIYRLEKQRIFNLQINLFKVYQEILKKIEKGLDYLECIQRVENLESEEEFQRNRYLMYDYLINMNFSKKKELFK